MWDAAVFRAVQYVFEQKCQHNALPLSGITGFMRSNYPSNYPLTLLVSVRVSFWSWSMPLCRSLSDGPWPGVAGGQAGGRGRLGESEWRCGAVLVKVAGSGITASPEWGSRCKAPIAPRSLSLLCGRPPQSCPLPPQLEDNSKDNDNLP